jgi:dolichyl-phosphate beta-glucosyltransferase
MKNKLFYRHFNYAIIIPCYNEELRLPYQEILTFSKCNTDVLLCFVNDGSIDKTKSVLNAFQMESNAACCVIDLHYNVGKAEAVRKGMMYIYNTFDVRLIGFLDADLSTTLEEWLDMAKFQHHHDHYAAIIGSRINRLGARIIREKSRSIFSTLFRFLIKLILNEEFQDTQCGAKVFKRELVPYLFGKSYISPWLFDVEIFLRIQKKFGKKGLQQGVLEYPLIEWHEVGHSKLSLKHAIMMPFSLYSIYVNYKRNLL